MGGGLAAGVVLELAYVLAFGQRHVDALTVKNGTLPAAPAAAFYLLMLGVSH